MRMKQLSRSAVNPHLASLDARASDLNLQPRSCLAGRHIPLGGGI